MRRGENGRIALLLLALLALTFLAVLGLAAFRAGGSPEITIAPAMPAIGKRTPVTVSVRSQGRGLGNLRVELIQGPTTRVLAEEAIAPAAAWAFWSRGTPSREIKLEVGRETVQGLTSAPAILRVTAARAGSWLRRPAPAVREIQLPVRLVPPTLQVLSSQTYVRQGGSEAVVYRVGESAVRDGVRCGEQFFEGSPLPGGGPLDRFVLFGIPFDMTEPSTVKLVAEDDVGNEAIAAFVDQFDPQPILGETLTLGDAFLEKVVSEIVAQTPDLPDKGSLLDNYLQINGDLRRKNAAELVEISRKSAKEFLWSRPFQAMPNSKVMSSFADRREYVYQGRVVDRQVHLGFDLASTRGALVPAANDGTVVLARYFGIYGNTVIVDHGFGLMSLYGHLSSIDVSDGQAVKRGDTVGKSGQTGLAGGDHLHFSMLLHGMPVNPKEWWDGHWIADRLARKLGSAFPFQG